MSIKEIFKTIWELFESGALFFILVMGAISYIFIFAYAFFIMVDFIFGTNIVKGGTF